MSQPSHPPHAALKWKRYFIRLAGSLIILALLSLVFPGEKFWAASARVPLWTWIISIGLYLSLHFLGAIKWALVINAAGARLGLRDAAYCYYSGLFCSLWLPSLVGGDVVRAGMALSRSQSKTGLLSGSVLDRIADVGVLLAISLAAAAFVARGSVAEGLGLGWRMAIVLGGAVSLGLAVVAAVVWLVRFNLVSFRHKKRLVLIRRALRQMRGNWLYVIAAIGLAVLLQSSLVLLQAWLGEVSGFQLALALWFFAWPLAKLSAIVPISLGGLGVRETALVALLVPFGAKAADVVGVGLVFEVIVFGGGLVSGLIVLVISRYGAGQPRVEALQPH